MRIKDSTISVARMTPSKAKREKKEPTNKSLCNCDKGLIPGMSRECLSCDQLPANMKGKDQPRETEAEETTKEE